jgi:tetratricopeptide (TPR) repeat protein
MSRSIKDSVWVKKELKKALQLNKRKGIPKILPVLIENCIMPSELEFFHYADFRDNFEQPFQILLKEILNEEIKVEHYKSENVSSAPYKDTQQNEAIQFYNRGILSYQQGNLEEAVKFLVKAYEIDPHNLDIPYNLAVATYDLAEKKDNRELMELAANYYERIIQLRPDDVDALVNLGVIYNTRNEFGRMEKAKELFERALSLAPDYALAHLNLGHYYSFDGGVRELGEIDELPTNVKFKPDSLRKALLYYSKALELDENLSWQCVPSYKAIKRLISLLESEGLF